MGQAIQFYLTTFGEQNTILQILLIDWLWQVSRTTHRPCLLTKLKSSDDA
ncbi:hypothetical protein M758_N003100 [Ceratodon purpureus]|nr:hypothetical protein M758_N003100 [Ceratodon purpureus]